ncbi:MAG TPA: hypothetical protein VKB87_14200, partial [Myxococcaceae bacterium]|nr:hypothetical protein [Myxococcaceae bacterium]
SLQTPRYGAPPNGNSSYVRPRVRIRLAPAPAPPAGRGTNPKRDGRFEFDFLQRRASTASRPGLLITT